MNSEHVEIGPERWSWVPTFDVAQTVDGLCVLTRSIGGADYAVAIPAVLIDNAGGFPNEEQIEAMRSAFDRRTETPV